MKDSYFHTIKIKPLQKMCLPLRKKIANFDFEPVYSYYEYEHSVDEHSLDLKMIYDPKKLKLD